MACGSRGRGSVAWKEVWQYGQRRQSDQGWRITECCLRERGTQGWPPELLLLPTPTPRDIRGAMKCRGLEIWGTGEWRHQQQSQRTLCGNPISGLKLLHLSWWAAATAKALCPPGFGNHLGQDTESDSSWSHVVMGTPHAMHCSWEHERRWPDTGLDFNMEQRLWAPALILVLLKRWDFFRGETERSGTLEGNPRNSTSSIRLSQSPPGNSFPRSTPRAHCPGDT
uniref:Uncharacterized protein n=1 Tax=Molossus molossus TaxID=27622 RepID=A0A7J8J149_MOLMO|nr:hypothetical protein HJG59_010274 [Molossus molossus]